MSTISDRPLPCFATIRAVYDDLSAAERRVADYILANPGEVVVSSIADVARASSTGLATVGRLCVKLGYGGFPKLKVALAVELYNAPDNSVDVSAEDKDSALVRRVFAAAEDNLRQTAARLTPGQLSECADVLMSARRVEIFAVGGLSIAVAYVMQHRLMVAGIPCSISVSGPQQQDLAAGLLSAGDVAVGVSKSGVTTTLLAALQTAANAGARIVGICSSPTSPLTELAEVTLLASALEGPEWSHTAASHIPMHAVVDALYAVILSRRYEQH